MKSPITTHVLDTSTGKPAAGVPVILERQVNEEWLPVGEGKTDSDGRISDWVADNVPNGTYRLSFDTGTYLGDTDAFYPVVRVVFRFKNDGRHCHIPLLLSPYGYSTYRGS